jgi:hypothetical protein
MKISKMFPKRYATGEDLQGKTITLTITTIALEKMHPQPNAPEAEKWVIYFKEAKKGIILSRTLANQIAEVLGSDETDEWLGKRIMVYPQPMTVAGRKVTAIRARTALKGQPPDESRLPSRLMDED